MGMESLVLEIEHYAPAALGFMSMTSRLVRLCSSRVCNHVPSSKCTSFSSFQNAGGALRGCRCLYCYNLSPLFACPPDFICFARLLSVCVTGMRGSRLGLTSGLLYVPEVFLHGFGAFGFQEDCVIRTLVGLLTVGSAITASDTLKLLSRSRTDGRACG